MTSVDDLQRQIAVLQARNDVRDLMGKYARLTDTGPDADAIAALFTEDGVYEAFGYLGAEGGNTGPKSGREAIRQTFAALPKMMSFAAHYLCNPEIQVNEDATKADGRWLALEFATIGEKRTPIVMVAQYHNDFVRESDGWRIQRIRFGDLRSFPYTEGWSHTRYISMFDLHTVQD